MRKKNNIERDRRRMQETGETGEFVVFVSAILDIFKRGKKLKRTRRLLQEARAEGVLVEFISTRKHRFWIL